MKINDNVRRNLFFSVFKKKSDSYLKIEFQELWQ